MTVHDFNIHRIGLFCIRHPLWGVFFFCILLAIGAYGTARVQIDRDLPGSWLGESPQLDRLHELNSKLGGERPSMFVLVGGDQVWTREGLTDLQNLQLDLTLIEGIDSAISVFSLPAGDISREDAETLIPQDLDSVTDFDALQQRVAAHPLASGNLVSRPDGPEQWLLYLVTFADRDIGEEEETRIVHEVEAVATQHGEDAGMHSVVGGLPKAKLDIVEAVQDEVLFYSVAGLLVGIAIAAFYFRSFRFVFIASVSPVFAAALSFGCMGLLGVKVSMLLSAVPSLVLALSFTDTMHMMSDLRRETSGEGGVRDALARTMNKVGPACTVASITTAVSMLSLLVADAALVRQFGIVAAMATMVAVVSLMVTVPLLTRILLHKGMPGSRRIFAPPREGTLKAVSRRLAKPIMNHRKAISVVGMLATATTVVLFFQLQPKYRLGDQLPDRSSYRTANQILDERFDGANTVLVALDLSKSQMTAEDLLQMTRHSKQALASIFPDKSIISVDALRGDEADAGRQSDTSFDRWVLDGNETATNALFSPEGKVSALSFRIRDAQAATVVSLAEKAENALKPVIAAAPGAVVDVTGLPVIMAQEIPAMIVTMNWSLFGAFVFVFLLLGYLFRSATIIVLSVAPNLLPVFAAGLVVSLLEGGISLACIVGLTVGFGLAVDNTSHFLNRLMIESDGDRDVKFVPTALIHISPILMATTAVLVACLTVTAIGQTPTARIFSVTCIAVLIFALIANLVFLPALTAVVRQRKLV